MTEAPPPLFDVDAVRSLAVPTVGILRRSTPTVVLGSTQHVADLDGRAITRGGVSVRRRRGGGGAVLLRPDDCWVELWLPATPAGECGDVRSTAYLVGEWWDVALAGLGVPAEQHRGGLRDADQGAVACFAGLGPGELTVAGRKLVGLSQWRARQGALVSSIVATRAPGDLSIYLASGDELVPRLKHATCLGDVLPDTVAEQVADAFCRTVSASLPTLRREELPFS